MQGSYQPDKPFFDAFKTFFVVTVYQAPISEILRKFRKNWTLFSAIRSIAGNPLWPYL